VEKTKHKMAEVDFDGKAGKTFERTLVKDDVYVVSASVVDDKVQSFIVKDKKTGQERTKKRMLIRWKLPDGKELVQFTSVDVKKGNVQNDISPTGSYSFLEKAGELENFRAMCAGKSVVEDFEVVNFFKSRFIGRQARVTTRTVRSAKGEMYSAIAQFLEIMPKQ